MVNINAKVAARSSSNIKTKKRKVHELHLVNKSTEDYITGKKPEEIISLQEIKDNMKTIKNNPFDMHMESGHANAQIRTDMLYLVRKGLTDKEGSTHKVKAKELGSRVLFFNAQVARNIIAAEKDPKVKQEMQLRFEKITALPDRESYGKQ